MCIRDRNVVDRTCKETTEKLLRGFDSLLDMGELLIRVLSLLIILTLQVWWIGLAILAVSIPLFRVSLKAGKENYEAYRNAEKKTREAQPISDAIHHPATFQRLTG